jgi:integrase
MATVHRQPGSPYFFAFYRLPAGKNPDGSVRWKQVKKSTRKRTRSEATAAATDIERAALLEAGATGDRSRQFLGIVREAADDAARGMLTESLALDYISRITELATGKPVQSHTIESWLKGWLADKKRSKANGTALRYTGVVDSFLKTLSTARRAAPLASLTVDEVRAFRDAQLDAGKSAATANLAVKTLRIPLSLARRQGILQVNAAEGVDRVEGGTFEKGTFSMEDVQALLANAEGDWKGVILAGVYTGARLRDITNLTWGCVDLAAGVMTFTAAKTRKPVQVPLHSALKDHFLTLSAPDTPDEPVFPTLAGKSAGGLSGLSMAFRRIMAKAKLAGKTLEAAGKKGRKRNSLSFHSLRHTFTSALAKAGVTAEVRSKLTGHLDAKTHQRYTHHELEALQGAVDKLPTVNGGKV